jgi:hypothetical protein
MTSSFSVEIRCSGRREGELHQILSKIDLALEYLADFAEDALAHARAIELSGDVRPHKIAHAGGLRELRGSIVRTGVGKTR